MLVIICPCLVSDQSGEQDSLIFYRGFSAQSSSIPSISWDSCNSATKPMASSKNSSNSSVGQAISSTSSPMISVPTSPDENSTPKKFIKNPHLPRKKTQVMKLLLPKCSVEFLKLLTTYLL